MNAYYSLVFPASFVCRRKDESSETSADTSVHAQRYNDAFRARREFVNYSDWNPAPRNFFGGADVAIYAGLRCLLTLAAEAYRLNTQVTITFR